MPDTMITLTIVLSSGIVSAIVTLLTFFFTFGQYKQKVDSNQKLVEKISDKISELSDRISRLEGGIDRDRAPSEYIKKQSPLGLTDKGKSLLLDSHGKDYIDTNKDMPIKAIKSKNPKTAYDVQELAREIIKNHSNNDDFNLVKDFIYKQGLSLDTVIDVMGIYLRDIALPTLGFNISDIKD